MLSGSLHLFVEIPTLFHKLCNLVMKAGHVGYSRPCNLHCFSVLRSRELPVPQRWWWYLWVVLEIGHGRQTMTWGMMVRLVGRGSFGWCEVAVWGGCFVFSGLIVWRSGWVKANYLRRLFCSQLLYGFMQDLTGAIVSRFGDRHGKSHSYQLLGGETRISLGPWT